MSFKDIKLLAVILLVAATFILSMDWVLGTNKHPRFHEIIWDSRSIVDEMVEKMENDSANIKAFVTNSVLPFEISKRQNTDTVLLQFRNTHRQSLRGLKQKLLGLNDSMWEAFAKPRLFIVPDSLQIDKLDLNKIKKSDTQLYLENVSVIYRDTSLPLKQARYKIKLPLKIYKYSDDFITKYPMFGSWTLLIIIQITLFALFIPWLLSLLFSKSVIENISRIKVHNGVKSIYIVSIIAFCCVLYNVLLKSDGGNVIVKPQYFMAGLNDVFDVLNYMGYFAAGLCLAGMIFFILEIQNVQTRLPVSIEVTKYLDERFKIYFSIAAVILSLAVFASGTFFSALNSLDFIRQISLASGKSPICNDYVYLYGLVHTFLLLMFYIPARHQLDKLKSTIESPNSSIASQNWASVKKLTELAIAGSPLLAGLLQSLIEMWSS